MEHLTKECLLADMKEMAMMVSGALAICAAVIFGALGLHWPV